LCGPGGIMLRDRKADELRRLVSATLEAPCQPSMEIKRDSIASVKAN
jgi:hypothetical protein